MDEEQRRKTIWLQYLSPMKDMIVEHRDGITRAPQEDALKRSITNYSPYSTNIYSIRFEKSEMLCTARRRGLDLGVRLKETLTTTDMNHVNLDDCI